jgi:predicted site-specific integrase-resolvase
MATPILPQTTRVAIYARVSTTGQGQDVTMQTRELQKYAEARGWTVTSEYIDEGFSGAKDSRPELNSVSLFKESAKLWNCPKTVPWSR